MAKIFIGGGSGSCILNVPTVPTVGSNIHITISMFEWVRTDNAYLLANHTYRVTAQGKDVDTNPKNFGKIPSFSLGIVPDTS